MFSSTNHNRLFCDAERANNYNTLLRQHNNINNEMRSLKSHMYELCQQSTADRGLCNRIRNSIDTFDYKPPVSTLARNNTGPGNGNAAVVVMETAKL